MLPPKGGMALSVLTDVTAAEFGMSVPRLVSVLQASSGMSMLVLFVQMVEPGTLTVSLASVQLPPRGTVSLVLSALEVEFTAMSLINVNAQVVKPSTDSSVQSTVPLVNSTTKRSRGAHARQVNSGMETFVYSASVDKPGILHSILVSVQHLQSGTVTHALTHVQVEESSILSVDNASAPLVTGTELPA